MTKAGKDEGSSARRARPPRFEPLDPRLLLSGQALDSLDAPIGPEAPPLPPAQQQTDHAAEEQADEAAAAVPAPPVEQAAESPSLEAAAASSADAEAAPAAAPVPPDLPHGELPNDPIGEAVGLHPGRVVWVRDPAATSGEVLWDHSQGFFWDDDHTDQVVVDEMLSQAIRGLAGEPAGDQEAWEALFRHSNVTRGRGDRGYQPGERIAVKLNLNTNDDYTSRDNEADVTPQLVLSLLRQLVYRLGVSESDIALYDSIKCVNDKIWEPCHAEFRDVVFADKSGLNGRQKCIATAEDVIFYGNGQSDKVPTLVAEADYLINFAILKKHDGAGITLCGKNHFGSLMRTPAHLHDDAFKASGSTMGNYSPFVDYMGSDYLGGKTVLYLIDALWAGWNWGTQNSMPRKWQSAPFHGDWPSSILVSQDPVGIDSVACDLLTMEDAAINSQFPTADNYLHEGALANAPPSGAFYDPNHPGHNTARLPSMGVHEHWNNATDKQYTRNLGTGEGIELACLGAGMNQLPWASITEPAEGAAFGRGADVTVVADASDPDGYVAGVEFFADGESIFLDADGGDGWQCTWIAPPPGEYALRAKATDELGAAGWSTAVNVTVGAVLSIDATDGWASEAGDTAAVTLYREGDTSEEMDVHLAVGGSADAGADYEALDTVVHFDAGADEAVVSIRPLDDDLPEGAETVTVRLLDDAAYGLGLPDEATVTIADDELPPGLLAWWTFDQIAAGVAADGSGRGRDLDVIGATWTADGRIGGALRFDGVDDRAVDEDGEGYVNGLEAFTLAMWIKADAASVGTERGFFVTQEPGSSSCLSVRYDADGYYGGGTNVIKAYVQTTEGHHQNEGESGRHTTDWQHVALTWDPDAAGTGGHVWIYVNGVPEQLTYDEVDDDGPLTGVLSGATKVIVGQGYKTTEGAWQGLIDDVRLYDRALGDSEIRVIMNVPPTVAVTAPASGTVVALGSDLAVSASAADVDGTIERVEFWDLTAGLRLVELPQAPYEGAVPAALPGERTIAARAFDELGAMAQSDPITLTVALAGDADIDGDVDFDDYSAARACYGQSGVGWPQGDSDGDGDVDFRDYLAIKRNYGRPLTAGAAEPTAGGEAAALPAAPSAGAAELATDPDGERMSRAVDALRPDDVKAAVPPARAPARDQPPAFGVEPAGARLARARIRLPDESLVPTVDGTVTFARGGEPASTDPHVDLLEALPALGLLPLRPG